MKTHRLHIQLEYIQPPVWRRVEAPSDMTLVGLHYVIQHVMPWDNDHLHEFVDRRRKRRFACRGEPDVAVGPWGEPGVLDAGEFELSAGDVRRRRRVDDPLRGQALRMKLTLQE